MDLGDAGDAGVAMSQTDSEAAMNEINHMMDVGDAGDAGDAGVAMSQKDFSYN